MDVLVKYAIVACSAASFLFGTEWMQLGCLLMFLVSGMLTKTHVVGAVVLYYFIVLLPVGFAAYDYSSLLTYSVIIFTVPFVLNVVVVSIALTRPVYVRPFAVILGILFLALPPLSAFTIVSPIPLAGSLFPGLGEIGILLFLTLAGLLTVVKTIGKYLPLLVGLTVSQSTTASVSAESIIGIDTAIGMPSERQQITEFYLQRYSQMEIAEASRSDVVVFPEGAFGEWNNEAIAIFNQADVTILGGARIKVDDSSYVNALVNGRTGEVVYQQKEPIPLQMAGAMKSIEGTNEFNGYPAVLICNEIVNPWRAYQVFKSNKNTVIWIANIGWTDMEFVKTRLVSNVNHWAKLFNKKTVVAINTHG